MISSSCHPSRCSAPEFQTRHDPVRVHGEDRVIGRALEYQPKKLITARNRCALIFTVIHAQSSRGWTDAFVAQCPVLE